jgi:arylsulfatase A-like enzyme
MAGLLVLSVLSGCPCSPSAPRSLLLIVFDTLRADRMSLYGHSLETTPYLVQHSQDFLRFAEVAAPAPWTVPSHASMLTGLWPAEHRAQWGSMRLDERFETLTETLASRGFCTIGLTANPLVGPDTGFDQGFDSFEVVKGPRSKRTNAILEKLVTAIREARVRDCRLFVYLNLMDAHIPYNAKPFGAQFDAPDSGPVRTASVKWQISAGTRPLSAAEKRQHAAAYDAAVRYLDDVVPRVLWTFREAGLLDDTLVVLTSDHGDGLGLHQEMGHSISVWEEQLHVPLLVRFPDGRRGGEVFADRTTLTALTPSILDWLAVPRPQSLRGAPDLKEASRRPVTADVRSYFEEQNRDTNAEMAELYPELITRVQHSHVLYCRRHKLIVEASGRQRLFDLASDPEEQLDLANREPSVLQACSNEYRRLVEEGRFTPFSAGLPEWAENWEEAVDLEALKALGYVQ